MVTDAMVEAFCKVAGGEIGRGLIRIGLEAAEQAREVPPVDEHTARAARAAATAAYERTIADGMGSDAARNDAVDAAVALLAQRPATQPAAPVAWDLETARKVAKALGLATKTGVSDSTAKVHLDLLRPVFGEACPSAPDSVAVDSLADRCCELEERAEAAEQRCKELEAELAREQRAQTISSDAAQSLKAQLLAEQVVLLERIDALKGDVVRLSSDAISARTQLQGAEDAASELRAELEAAQVEGDILREELAKEIAVNASMRETQRKFGAWQNELLDRTADLKRELADTKARLAKLREACKLTLPLHAARRHTDFSRANPGSFNAQWCKLFDSIEAALAETSEPAPQPVEPAKPQVTLEALQKQVKLQGKAIGTMLHAVATFREFLIHASHGNTIDGATRALNAIEKRERAALDADHAAEAGEGEVHNGNER